MATKTIGATGRDYSTISAWIAYLDALSFAGDETGNCYNDGEFQEVVDFISGITNSSFKVILTAASGQSFQDHASKTTNALRYNQSVGVGIRQTSGTSGGTLLNVDISNFETRRLQWKRERGYGQLVDTASNTRTGLVFEDSIYHQDNSGSGAIYGMRIRDSATLGNCLIINNTDVTGSSVIGLYLASQSQTVVNCTIVRTRTAGSTKGIEQYSGSKTVTNCAIFGYSDADNGTLGGSNNASDLAIGFGSANQASLTYASQFQSITTGSEDFRALASGSLDNAGTASGAPTADILGQTRAGTPWIGAHEVVSGGGGGGWFNSCSMIMHREPPQQQLRRLGFSGWRAATELRRAA